MTDFNGSGGLGLHHRSRISEAPACVKTVNFVTNHYLERREKCMASGNAPYGM